MAQWVQLVTQQIRTKTDTTTGELTEYSYDEFGNLERVDLPGGQGTINYRTDPRNRRIGRVVQNGRGEVTDERYWVYKDQLNPIAELDAQGRVTKRFVYGERANVASYMVTYDDTGAPTGTYRLIVDHLGSVRMVVDTADGHIAQRMRYDAFGNVLADTNDGFQPFGFAGGLYDPDTGLVRFGARDYDPRVGRWTAKDPLGFGGGDANMYAYVSGNPIGLIDPSGRSVGNQMMPGPGIGCSRKSTPWTFGADLGADWVWGIGWSIGVNFQVYQLVPGDVHLGLFFRGAPDKVGLAASVAATGNIGRGSGRWAGPFEEKSAGLGPATGSYYESKDGTAQSGYEGVSAGVSGGFPVSGSYAEQDYVSIVDFDL